jgi:CRP-like cAMP-binding protein
MSSEPSASRFERIAALRRSELFRSLSDTLLEKVAALAVPSRLNRDQVLFSEEDEASGVYVVVRGEFRSVRQSRDGREQVLSTESAGATLAVVAVFSGGRFYSTMIADTRAEAICVAKRDMHQLCREHPEILWNAARLLAQRVREHAELIETLVFRNVEERIAQHLLTIARQRGIPVGEGCTFEMTLTRTEMASRLGSVREVVSRALAHLQNMGLIRMQGQRLVTVPNTQALEKFAGTEHDLPEAKLASDISSELV